MITYHFTEQKYVAPTFHCNECGADLYDYDDCYLYGSTILCEDCANKRDDEYDWKTLAYELFDYYGRIYGGNEY